MIRSQISKAYRDNSSDKCRLAAARDPPRNTPASEEPWALLKKKGIQGWMWGQMMKVWGQNEDFSHPNIVILQETMG